MEQNSEINYNTNGTQNVFSYKKQNFALIEDQFYNKQKTLIKAQYVFLSFSRLSHNFSSLAHRNYAIKSLNLKPLKYA